MEEKHCVQPIQASLISFEDAIGDDRSSHGSSHNLPSPLQLTVPCDRIKTLHVSEWNYTPRNDASSPSSSSSSPTRPPTCLFAITISFESGVITRLERRYSAFRQLHRTLLKHTPSLPLVKTFLFPSKTLSCVSFNSPRVLNYRRRAFEAYLNLLMTLVPCPDALLLFLNLTSSNVNHEGFSAGRSESNSIASSTSTIQYMGGTSHHPPANTHTHATRSFSCKVGHEREITDSVAARFQFLKVLGKGSFGKVFLVRDRSTHALLAMKVLTKAHLASRNQISHTQTERRIMGNLPPCPFIVTLREAFETATRLYLLSDYCNGGEIFFHLKKFRVFSEAMVKFYAAELILALEHLHLHGVVYRDMKPENILLDAEGHLRITDFGLSRDQIFFPFKGATTFCGTPEYLAPEMLEAKKTKGSYGISIDWYSLGTLLFEMVTGWPPFYDANTKVMCDKIMSSPLVFPRQFGLSPTIQSLIAGLLTRDPTQRLGCSVGAEGKEDETGGVAALKAHPFFDGTEWELVVQRIPKPPFCPRVTSATDISNFDIVFTKELLTQSPQRERMVPPMRHGQGSRDFPGFYYSHTPSIEEDQEGSLRDGKTATSTTMTTSSNARHSIC